jgi:hypothetical protein
MKKLLLLLLFIPLTFACGDDDNDSRLTITNDAGENFRITRVGFVGYEFSDLNIQNGQSQTFRLVNGLINIDGNSLINVNTTHICGSQGWNKSHSVYWGEGSTSLSFVFNTNCGSGTCRSVCLIPE